MRPGHAEVAGGGVAGLIAATALAQRGWSVRVHEQASHLRSFGAGITCWYNFVKVLRAIGAAEEAVANCLPFHARETRDEANRVLYRITASDKPQDLTFTITRQHLMQALSNAARRAGVEIVTSSRAVGADASGILELESGARHRADLIVAADGIRSPVRDSLNLLACCKPLNDGAIRLLIPRTEHERQSEDGRKGIEYWSGRRRLYYTACGDDNVYLALMLSPRDKQGAACPINKATWIESFPLLRELIERVGDGGRWDQFEQIKLHRWSAGRVAVVGDAAHAMAPNIGQGGGIAAMNALSLAEVVSKGTTVEDGLDAWERQERPLTEFTQRVSQWYGRLNDLPPGLRMTATRMLGRWQWIIDLRQRAANHTPTGYTELLGSNQAFDKSDGRHTRDSEVRT